MGSKIVKKYGYKFVVDGQEKEVDESRFNDYGGIESYKEDFPDASVRMTSASGKQANIPLSKYDDAVKAGFALSKWEKNDTINEPSENDFAEYFIDGTLTEEQKNINNAATTDAPAMTMDQIEQAVGEADGDVDTTATTETYPNIPAYAPNREAYKRNLEAWKAKNSMSADDMWASAEDEELKERLNRFDSGAVATHTPLRVEDKDANLQSIRDIVDRNKAVNDIYSDVNKKMLEYGQRDMLGKDRAVQSGVEFNPETKQFQPKYVDATGGETFNKEEAKATSRAAEEIVRTQNVNDAMAYHFENDDELMSEIDKRIADIEAQGKEYTERRKAAKGQENSSLFERFISSAKDVDNRNKGTHVSPEVALSEDLNDPEFRNLITQKILLQQAKKRMEASKRKDKGFWGEFTEGGADALVNPETLGGSTFTPIIGSELAKVSKKWERGEKLTEDEQNLVIVAGLLNEAQSKDTALGYDIGDMLGQVLPFIAEVAMNPAQGSSKAITKGVFKGLMRRYGATAIGNKLATNIGKRLTTGALRAAGDIGQASALAGTLQAPKVIGGAGKRMAGTAEYSMGADGELKAKGFTKKEGSLEALGKSFATMAIENYTELLGEQFGALAKGFKYLGGKVGKGANKVLPKALTNVAKQTAKKGGEFMRDAAHLLRLDYINAFIKSQGLNKWINANEAFEKQIAFNGLAGEILEEEIAIPLNALLVGDEKIENLADYEHQMQILLGTALMTGGMAALRTPSFVNGKRKASKDYNKATLAAERAIGKEEWEALRDRIDLADNDVLGDEVATIANNSAYNKEQKAAIVNYAEALQKQRGYNLFGDVKQKRGQWDSLYDEGYEAEGDNMGVVVSQLAEARAKVGEVFAIAEDGKLNDPIAYMAKYGGKQGRKLADAIEHDEDLSNEEKAMLLDYAKAEYRYNAMMEGIEDRVDSQLEEDAKAFDDITNKDTGTVMKVLVKGKDGVQFYAKSGNIIYDNTTRAIDGAKTEMANGSPMVVLYDPQARKSIAVSVYDLEMVVENVNADRLKVSMFESRRDALMAAEMQLVDGYATEARASILDRRTQEQKADEANSGYGDNSGNSEVISDTRTEEQKVLETEGQDPNSLTEEQKSIIAPGGQKAVEATGVAERGGKAVDVEDVIAVYEFSKTDATAARKQPDVYERFIDDLEFDRQMAIAWSKGDPASRKPDYWEYWKEREGLSEPTTSLGTKTEGQVEAETKEQKAVEAEDAVNVQEYVAKWNDNTGENVQVANSVEEVANAEARAAIEQGVKVKGWYDTRTGEVVVYAPNVKSAEDLVLTIVHENVSHKGLRDTLGEDMYNKMCDKTWEMMDEATRAKYESYAGVNSIKDETERHRAAADEYIASIAEKVEKEQKLTESERSIWSEVLKAIKEFIVKLYGDVKLTEQDIASIIRVSYDRMRARGDIEANSVNSGAEAKATETAPVVEAPKAEKKAGEDIAKVEDVELKPIGRGKFGNIYNQFKGKAKEAIQFLLGKKEGEAIGALHHPDIGDIDLVWGKEGTGKSDGFGLAKLVKYHPEVLDNLQEILSDMHVTKRTENRVQLESDTHQAAVRLTWDNEKKNWLLTAFEKRNSAFDNTTDTVKISKRDMRNDTTTSQNTVSESKGSEKVEDNEGKVNKSEVGRYPKELFEGVKDNAMAVREAKTIFDKYSKVASIEEMIEYRDTLIAWNYLNESISDAENGLTKITDEEYDSLLEAQRQTDHRWTEIRDDFEKRLEESQKIEAPKAEKKVVKPRAKSRPVDAKKEISRRLEEEWNDAPSDVKSTIESIANTDEVIDVEDVVYATLAELRSPKTRHKLILQGDGVIKGVTEELGLPAKELQKALGVNAFATRANGGISLQKMAENIVADLDRNITGASNIDVADVRDMLIEAIQSAGEPADISYHRARRRIDVAEKVYADWKRNELELEAEYEREADAERAAEEFWLTEQEKAYESMEINYLDNTFADELAERERIINEQNRKNDEQTNKRGSGSDRLLHSEQVDTSRRMEDGTGERGIQEEVGDAVSWIQNAETQRGQVGGTTQRKVEAEVAKASKAKTAKKKAGEDIAKVEEAMKAEKAKRELKTKEDIEMRLAEIREEYEADKEGRDIQTQAEAMVELYGGYANAPKDVKAKIDAQVAKLSARRQELAAEERELEKKLATLTKKQTPTTLDTRTEEQKADGGYSGEGGVRFAVVEDEELIKRLDADEKVIGYRNVVLNEDGTFESPMANSLRSTDRKAKEKTGGFELNKWERSEERPHLVDEDGKITLVKPDGKAVEKVDYNPYIHNRLNRVNKQFKQAWERPNLVYIKTEIPLSDLESGYHAEKAKLPVGEHKWNGGNLILSRYDKPVEICDWNDVADDWQASFKKEGINFDIIPPALLPILEERGMKIIRPHKNMGDACNKAYADWAEARGIDTKGFWAEVAKETEEAERAKAEKQAKAKSKKAEGGVRFRFIGEEGAKSMDKKEGTTARMDNLAVAKKMLDEYSYKEVKMATGWEKGMDGKWRYETPDFEQFDINGNLKFVQRHPDYARYRELVKKNHMAMLLNQDPLTEAEQAELDKLKAKWGGAFGKMDNVTTLDAYVQDDDLFKAYPELKSIRVKLTDELPKGTRGRFVRREADDILILDPEEIQGTIYLNSRYPLREVESTLIHEIQHVIQHIEGFAKGGNSEMINEEEQRKYGDAIEFTKERIESHRQLIHEYLEQQGEISDKINDWYNRHGDEAEFDAEMRALDEKWDAIDKKIDGVRERIKEDEQWLEAHNKKDFRLGYDGYRALAGEVEARNVQKRRGMTAEERRNSLAEETEDVKRGQQIVVGAMGSDSLDRRTEEQNGGVRFSVGENEETREMNSKQKVAGKQYNVTEPLNVEPALRFRVSNRQRETIMSKKWLGAREDLTEAEKESFIEWLDAQDYDSATTLATARWFANGTIRVPEDMPKVEQAMKVAKVAKVDATSFRSPMELIDQFADIKPKEKAINPDDVSTLSNKKELPHGIAVYDVEESQASRENMRKIINTHFGEEANPWCLLQGDGKGNLTEGSERMWNYYNKFPKRVAFKDGKLIAFFASNDMPTWWDRQDAPHSTIPYSYKENGKTIEAEYNEETRESWIIRIYKGDRKNGLYEEWYANGQIRERVNRTNGKRDGLHEEWYANGQMEARVNWKNGKRDGVEERWYEDGQMEARVNWKNGKHNGVAEYWWNNGQIRSHEEHGEIPNTHIDSYNEDVSYTQVEPKRVGVWERWGKNGVKIEETKYENDKIVEAKSWYNDGTLQYSRTQNGNQSITIERPNEFSDRIITTIREGNDSYRTTDSRDESSTVVKEHFVNGSLVEKDMSWNEIDFGLDDMGFYHETPMRRLTRIKNYEVVEQEFVNGELVSTTRKPHKSDDIYGSTRFSVGEEGGEYAPVWGENESFAEANDRIRRKKTVLDIQLKQMERKRALGKSYDADKLEQLRAELEEVKAQIRYLEVGAPKPELAEGESETDASYVAKMNAWHDAMAEWNSKKYGEDAMLDNLLREASGAKADEDVTDEEFKQGLKDEEEKANLSVKEMKGLVKEQIRERRRGIEVSNWQDEMTIYDIKTRTTEEQRKLIPHILEGTYNDPQHRKDKRYADYLAQTGKTDVSSAEWSERKELLNDPSNVENTAITKNQHGLKESDIVEYAVDSDAEILVTGDNLNALIRFPNGDIYTLRKYGVQYLLHIHPEAKQNTMTAEDAEMLGMFLRGEAEQYVPQGLREYVEKKEYDEGNTLEVVNEIREWYAEAWSQLEAEGMVYKKEAIEDYVTHIWDLKKSSPTAVTTMQKFLAATAPKALKDINNYVATNTPYVKERAIGSIRDGEAFGLVPKYEDITDIMRDYGHRMNEARENRRLVNFVKGLRVNGMEAIKEEGGRSGGLYIPIKNEALRGYEVHRDVKPVLDVIFGEYHTTDNLFLQKLGHVYDAWGGLLKKINLSLSFFHHGALTETAIAMTNPFYAGKTIFKNILWDAAFKGDVIKWAKTMGDNSETPAYNDVELTKDAVSHFVQLGATSDYATKEVQAITAKFAEWAEGKVGAEELATVLDFWNKGLDKFLWDYLHDGLKIYGYKKLSTEIRAKAEKEGWDEEVLNRALDEAGQLINDTYGGQHWDLLGVSPNALKWARRAFLSPDWTLSTLRQALAPFGYGQMYDDSKFWKKWFKNDPVADVRKRYGRAFWVTAALFFGGIMNGLNAYYRMKDEDEEKKKAEEIRKTRPEYKSPYELAYPDGMRWWDYTMLGNTQGHETHLFGGRYKDGKEQYVRWGKQFRELPELFFGRDGLSFPQPMIDKITGKLNPMINLMSNLSSGYSLNGFQNDFMRDTRGWDREWARLQVLIAAHLPYSIPTDGEKEFKMIDLVMPSTKGFSNWKGIDRFKTAILAGDMDFCDKVYDACVKNGLHADELLDVAIKQIEVDAKRAMVEGVEDLSDAVAQHDKETNPVRKQLLANYIKKQMSAQDYEEITKEEMREKAYLAINGGVSDKNIKLYDKLCNSNDVIEDWRITKGKAGLKKYVDDLKALKEETDDAELIAKYVADNAKYLNQYKQLDKVQGVITSLKKRLGEGKDAEVMAQIREVRKKAFTAKGQEYGKKKKAKAKKEKPAKPIADYGKELSWSESEE